MKRRTTLRCAWIWVLIILCMVLCAGCGDLNVPKLEDNFTDSNVKQWKNEEHSNRHTMNGGYFLHFKGNNYAIEFDDGEIIWEREAPDELFFADMSALYSDADLEQRCCYLGDYKEWSLFGSGTSWSGYILDGVRPKYGSVLYISEKELDCRVNNSESFAPDETITLSAVLCLNDEIITNEDGMLLEHINTPRKLFAYMKEKDRAENGTIKWRGTLSYANINYPSCFGSTQDDKNVNLGDWTMDRSTFFDYLYRTIDITEVHFADGYNIYLEYQSNTIPTKHFMLFTSLEEAKSYTSKIQQNERYTNIELNDEDVVIKYFDLTNDEEVVVAHSFEEFNQILDEEDTIDIERKQSVAYFKKPSPNSDDRFDGYLDYYVKYNLNSYEPSNYAEITLYPVWEECRTVQLCLPDSTMEVGISKKRDTVLPSVSYPGYEFEGWYADENYSGQPIGVLTPTSSYECLYAKFRKVDYYTLTFAPSEGKSLDDIRYVYGEERSLPKLTKSFHVFKGWCMDPECMTEPLNTISAEFYGSYLLYPCFEPRKYILMLTNGAEQIQKEVRYGEEFTLPIDGVGEGFIGYADIDGVLLTDSTGKSLEPFTYGADVQLFAKYKGES